MAVELAVVPETQTNPKDDNPYAEYMWMGEEENEFDLDVLAQLEEEEYLDQCFQEMLEEEALGLFKPPGETLTSVNANEIQSSNSLPPIQNLSLTNANGQENGHRGNGDVVLVPTDEVGYEEGAGGDGPAVYGQSWQDTAECPAGKDEHHSDSDSSDGSPQR